MQKFSCTVSLVKYNGTGAGSGLASVVGAECWGELLEVSLNKTGGGIDYVGSCKPL